MSAREIALADLQDDEDMLPEDTSVERMSSAGFSENPPTSEEIKAARKAVSL